MIIWQVASLGHRFVDSKIRLETLDDFNNELASTFYPGFSRYCKCLMLKINIQATNSQTGLTKLMNILWTNELQKRLDADGVLIITLSIHPGNVNTFADQLPMFRTVAKVIMGLFFKTWDQGAYNSVIGAALPAVREIMAKWWSRPSSLWMMKPLLRFGKSLKTLSVAWIYIDQAVLDYYLWPEASFTC